MPRTSSLTEAGGCILIVPEFRIACVLIFKRRIRHTHTHKNKNFTNYKLDMIYNFINTF